MSSILAFEDSNVDYTFCESDVNRSYAVEGRSDRHVKSSQSHIRIVVSPNTLHGDERKFAPHRLYPV